MNTEQKHEIDISGLPKGYRAVEAMVDPMSCNYIGDDGCTYITAKIKIEKIQPRRIVLEETTEDNRHDQNSGWYDQWFDDVCLSCQEKIWREVVEQVNEEVE